MSDGEKWSGVLGAYAPTATNEFAVRPALYVKTDAFTGGAEASPVIGDTVSFAGHEWYLIGTGLGGVTAPAGCYTLFAKYDDFGSTAFRAGASNRTVRRTTTRTATCKKRWRELQTVLCQRTKITSLPVTRWTISGDAVTDQLLWPISDSGNEKH